MSAPTFRLAGVVHAARADKEDFEGPLDLILHLISKNKIEIRDIRISELLEQYLSYLEQMKRMDLEIASEFIAMASHLVYIKSRMLLSLSDDRPEQELDLLMQALEERQRQEAYRRVAVGRDFLTARADIGRCLYTRLPEALPADKTYAYTHTVAELEQAMRDLASRFERRVPPTPAAFVSIVGREPYSVEDMIALVLRQLDLNAAGAPGASNPTVFSRLLALGQNRSEWVALFLAILELCRSHRLRVEELAGDYRVDIV